MGRILYVWSPNWPITTWKRRRPGEWREDEPFALVETGVYAHGSSVDGCPVALTAPDFATVVRESAPG